MAETKNQPKSILAREDDGTIQLTIDLPKDKVAKVKEEVLASVAEQAKVPGFRKGQAPKKLVEESINMDNVREEVLKKLLPEAYMTAVQEHHLRPIMNPKIHINKIEDDKDWTFTAVTCEMPEVDLGKYKENIKSVTAKSKIAIPGKEQAEPNMDEIMAELLKSAKVTVPKILVEQEVDRLLSQTLNEIKRLGLTLDQYLTSTGKNPDTLRAEYAQKAESDIKLEFILQKVADAENLSVTDKEIEEAVQKAKNPEEMQQLESNRYLLASILRQQKTLDFLKSL